MKKKVLTSQNIQRVHSPSRWRRLVAINAVGMLSALSVHATESLPALMGDALSTHPAINARQSEVRAAQSGVDSARWQYWPTPSLNIENGNKPTWPGLDQRSIVFSVKQPLWAGGRLDASLAQAQATESASDAGLQESRRDIVLELMQAYGDALSAQSRRAAHEKSLAVHDRLLSLVQRRTDEGISAQSDIQLAKSRRAVVLAERAFAQVQRDTAAQKLQTLAGRRLNGDLRVPVLYVSGKSLGQDSEDEIFSIDPTLNRLNAELRQIQAEILRSAAANRPEISARIDRRYGDVRGDVTQAFIVLESRWGAGLSASAATQAVQHRMEAKRNDILARKRRLGEAIETDRKMLEAALARAGMLESARDAAREVLASWDRQFLNGKKSWQDVLNAAREVAQAEVQLADAQSSAAVVGWRLAVLLHGVESVQRTLEQSQVLRRED